MSGSGVLAVDQFKYVDGEGLCSPSMPCCSASVHEGHSLLPLSYVSFDILHLEKIILLLYLTDGGE